MYDAELQDHLYSMIYYNKNPDIVYAVKIEVVSIRHVQVGRSPYIFIAGYPQANNESNEFSTYAITEWGYPCGSLKRMSFLSISVDVILCD